MWKIKTTKLLVSVIPLCFWFGAQGQKDSLVFSNGDIMVGEIKSMDKGVMTLETPYSKNDFTIKWIEVKEIYSKTRFIITLANGRRMNSILTTKKPGELVIENESGDLEEIHFLDLVFLMKVESKFWSRVNASVDIGLSVSKANHLNQFNGSATLGYLTDTWGFDAFGKLSSSAQDSIASTIRKEAGLNFRYFLEKDWYILPEGNYLSNTEQALKARITAKLGVGRYLSHSNRSYWGFVGGLSFNNETFTNETEMRSSAEAYAGTEINLFDIGDLSMLSNIYVYPSLTERGRIRSDSKLDLKYEFANDFYFKLNVTYNYDNRPAIQGNESDYVFGFSIGWEL
jgi:hypothetical protein